MKTEAEIVAAAFAIPSVTGIYFLISNGEIVYVGQSRIPIRRIGDHARDKIFDSVSFIPCGSSELDKLERQYIDKFKPRYNDSETGRFPIRGGNLPSDRIQASAEAIRPIGKDEYRSLRKRQRALSRPPRFTG